MKKILKRFREPSTWTSLGAMGAIFGVPVLAQFGIPEVATTAAAVVSLVAGVVLPEKSHEE